MSFGAKLLHDESRYERERRLLSNVSSVGDLAGVYDRHMVDSELTCGCQRAEFCAGNRFCAVRILRFGRRRAQLEACDGKRREINQME